MPMWQAVKTITRGGTTYSVGDVIPDVEVAQYGYHLLGLVQDAQNGLVATLPADVDLATQAELEEAIAGFTTSFAAGAGGRAQPNQSLLSAGTTIVNNTRFRPLVASALTRFDISWGAFYNNGGVESDSPNSFTVRAAVEYPAGTFTPVFFNGRRDAVVEPGGLVTCDPVYLPIPANTSWWVRTKALNATTNQQFPILGAFDSANGEGSATNTVDTDLTTSGSIGPNAGFGIAPFRVRAYDLPVQSLAVAVIGDSLTYGLNDSIGGNGWVGRAFDGVVNYQRIGFSSERGATFNTPATRRRRQQLIQGANVGIAAYGINDIGFAGGTLGSVQTILQANWAVLASMGMSVFQTTMPPRTTTTDAWATTTNQTPLATEALRVAVNDWVRTTPAGLTGYIEIADTVETARNSGRWKVTGGANGYTQDGIHGNATSYVEMASAATAAIPTLQAAA